MEFHVSAGLEFSREMLGAKEDQPVLSLNIHIHSHPSNTTRALSPHHSQVLYYTEIQRYYFKIK